MEKIILGGRYALLEKISEGGMSTIYKAYCNVLNRVVAVKILKQEFSNDEEFLKKFNNEAKSAASLNHPNIVGVYDIGSDDDVSYIVMEYVDGKNIKQIINERGSFAEKGALEILRQICVALKAAHDQGIVHRDIKPHNIMINKFGIVKVGDFGIAKATSSATITKSDSIMGSVHYISPEQAKAEYVDKRSDIYSLGIVFYEMLTGKVPYDEEKAINTALKHVNCQLEIPQKYKHIISPSVQNILLKMTQRNPNDRYLDVSQIIIDIDKIQNENEEINYFEEKDYHTKIMPSVNNDNIQKDDKKSPKKKKRGYKKYFLLLAIIVVALSSAYLISAGNVWDALVGNNEKIPDIVGKSLETATKEVEEANLKIKVMSEKEDKDFEEGTVLSQNPDAGIKLRKGEEVSVIVAKKPDDSTVVPDVVGKSLDEAKKLIEDKKLKYSVKYKFSQDVEDKFVISQSPSKDEKAKFDDVVTIEVSKGVEVKKEKIPNLVGATLDDARMITGNFSIGSITYKEDTSKPDGRVLSQEPEAGSEQVVGTQINIVINKIEKRTQYVEEKPKVQTEIVTKNLEVVLPKSENVLLTFVDKSSGVIVYSNTITVQEGENVSVQLSGHSGESKEFDIYIGGKYFATTGTITF